MTVIFLLSVPNALTSQFFKGFTRYPYILIISCILLVRHEIKHYMMKGTFFLSVTA